MTKAELEEKYIHWQRCLQRVLERDPKDTFSICMITGQLNKLSREWRKITETPLQGPAA